MSERNILAYFNTPEQAEGAKRKLESLRVVDASVDRFSQYAGEGLDDTMNPITGNFTGLGSMVLDGAYSGKSAEIMAAADPNASGMSGNSDLTPVGMDILLTVVVNAEDYDKAMNVVKEAGGLV